MKKHLFLSFFLFSLILFSSISLVSADVEIIHSVPNFVFDGTNLQICINLEDYASGFDVVDVYVNMTYCDNCISDDEFTLGGDDTNYFKYYATSDKFSSSFQYKGGNHWEVCLTKHDTPNYALYPLIFAFQNSSTTNIQEAWVYVSDTTRTGGEITNPNFYIPKLEANFPGVIDLGYDGVFNVDLDKVFSNFDTIYLDYYDSQMNYLGSYDGQPFFVYSDNPSGYHRGQFQDAELYNNDFPVWVGMFSDIINGGTPEAFPGQSFKFRVSSDQNDTLGSIKITAFNQYGSTYTTLDFSSSSDPTHLVNPYGPLYSNESSFSKDYLDVDTSSSFVGYLSGLFDLIFPNKDNLTLKQRFSYVLITFFLIDFLILILCFKSQNIKLAGILIIIIDVLMFFYFLAIGYIPITILIIFILIALVFSFFKIKAGG